MFPKKPLPAQNLLLPLSLREKTKRQPQYTSCSGQNLNGFSFKSLLLNLPHSIQQQNLLALPSKHVQRGGSERNWERIREEVGEDQGGVGGGSGRSWGRISEEFGEDQGGVGEDLGGVGGGKTAIKTYYMKTFIFKEMPILKKN